MLQELNIQNLGVIAQAELPFSPGFTALTGETGAGKTMILNALALLRGGKGDPALIRAGSDELVVEGRWDAHGWPAALEVLTEAGGATDDDGSVITTRSVAKTRSRAHLGGRSVPAATMADFTADLVTVHGQSDQIRLRTPARQREALDAFAPADHQANLGTYRQLWQRRSDIATRLDTLTKERVTRQQTALLLREQLAEYEAIDPQPGEHTELTTQVARLSNAEALRVAVSSAHQALAGSDYADDNPNAMGLIETARREVAGAVHDDATLEPLAERLAEVGYLVADIGADLARYNDDLDADPDTLEQLQSRLGALNALARKHGLPVDEVIDWSKTASLQLLDLDNDDDTIESLTAQLAELDSELADATAQVTAGRQAAAQELAAAVTKELSGLGMANSEVVVTVEPADPGPNGADQVTFSLIPHPGVAPRPIAKGASGGELSRLMLALELSLATRQASQPLPTFVFDEVDAGVGGKAATEIGRRLAELAKLTQVIVVTHLAQVAAFADQQLVVAKDVGETTVTPVQGSDRDAEIARMLSGNTSETALKHAQELLTSARATS